MDAKKTGRTAAAVRGLSVLERIVVVAALVAVLVAVGAGWFAMNRADGAHSAASSSAAAGSGGGISTGTDSGSSDAAAADDATGGQAAAGDASGDSASADSENPASGGSSSGSNGSSAGSSSSGGSSSRGSGSSTSGGTAPATAFLNALNASGMAPPVDDEQKVAMARDVCDELDNGSTYADMVRALTFAGATEAEATNFTRLTITNLCPEHPIG